MTEKQTYTASDMTTDDLLEVIRKEASKQQPFEINSLIKLTVGTPKGGSSKGTIYSKKAFIKGAKLQLFSAYIGKRNSIIFQFTIEGSATSDVVECTLKEAQSYLDGFLEWSESLFEAEFSKTLTKIKRQTKRLEAEREKAAADELYQDAPNYGTW